jgi:hypothetical protein
MLEADMHRAFAGHSEPRTRAFGAARRACAHEPGDRGGRLLDMARRLDTRAARRLDTGAARHGRGSTWARLDVAFAPALVTGAVRRGADMEMHVSLGHVN